MYEVSRDDPSSGLAQRLASEMTITRTACNRKNGDKTQSALIHASHRIFLVAV